jgi:glycosyltransferase involved in cell wall biosynthesis
MARRPTLGLCIPALNASGYLPRLLASVQRQTVPFDEILVFDDCSSDETAAVAEALGARVIRSHVNAGCALGKNRLAAAASTDWIHFHDSDDDLYPHFVEVATRWMEAPNRQEVVMIAYEDRDEEGRKLRERQFDDWALRVDPVRETILKQHNNCGIYLRQAFLEAGGFDTDPDVLYNEDDAMHCQLARAGLGFRAEPRVSAIVVQREGSMSRRRGPACARAKYHVLEKSVRLLPQKYEEPIALKLWHTAAVCGTYLDWEYAERCVSLARRLGFKVPPDGRVMFRLLCHLNPRFALRGRELAIRVLRPQLRRGADRALLKEGKRPSFSGDTIEWGRR